MDKQKASALARRMLDYGDWAHRRFSRYAKIKLLLFVFTLYTLVINDVGRVFTLSYAIPSLIIIGVICYFASVSTKVTRNENIEENLTSIFEEIPEEVEVNTDFSTSFSLKEAYTYDVLIEQSKSENVKPKSIINILVLCKLTNPIPMLLVLMFVWGLAVEIPSILILLLTATYT